MWVIDLTNAPERLRGTLARWGVEVRAGLYVGSAGAKVRDALWATVTRERGDGFNAVMIYDSTGPQGFEARTHGENRREVVDVDGLWLARFHPLPSDAAEPPLDALDPDAIRFDPSEFDPDYITP